MSYLAIDIAIDGDGDVDGDGDSDVFGPTSWRPGPRAFALSPVGRALIGPSHYLGRALLAHPIS